MKPQESKGNAWAIVVSVWVLACNGGNGTTPPSNNPTENDTNQLPALRAPRNVTAADNKDGTIAISWTADDGVAYDLTMGEDAAEVTNRAKVAPPLPGYQGSSIIGYPAQVCVENHIIITARRGDERLSAPPVTATATLGDDTCWRASAENQVFSELASNATATVMLARGVNSSLFRSTDGGQTFSKILGKQGASVISRNGSFWFLETDSDAITTTPDGVTFSRGRPLPVNVQLPYKSLSSSGGTPYLEIRNPTGDVSRRFRLNSDEGWSELPPGMRGVETTIGLRVEYSRDLSIRVAVGSAPPQIYSLSAYAGDCNQIDRIVSSADRLYAQLLRADGAYCSPSELTSVDGSTWVPTSYPVTSTVAKVAGKFVSAGHGIRTSDDGANFTDLPASNGRLFAYDQFAIALTTEAGAFFLSYTGELVRTTDGLTFTVVHRGPAWFDGLSDGNTVLVLGRAGDIAISRDQGATFVQSALAGSNDGLRGIYKFAPGSYVVYGDLGALYVTKDAGVTWSNWSDAGWGTLTAAAGDNSRLFLVSTHYNYSSNHVLVSTDGGSSFALDDVSTAPHSCLASYILGSSLYCDSSATRYVSSDGVDWQTTNTPVPGYRVQGDASRRFMWWPGLTTSVTMSTDGTLWPAVNWPSWFLPRALARASNRWFALEFTGEFLVSSDAVTWSSRKTAPPPGCDKMIGANERLVCASGSGIHSIPTL